MHAAGGDPGFGKRPGFDARSFGKTARIHSLVEAISDEAAQLDGFIQNLLNATRVTAGGVSPHLEWADPRDIVNAAIKGRARRLAAHKVEIEFAEDLPLVNVDSGLIEEVVRTASRKCRQILAVRLDDLDQRTGRTGRVILSISDQGVGITPDEQQQLGRRSFRSQRHQATIPGSGLGFWIASTFVRANGGTIDISSRGQGQGTTASIALPGSPMRAFRVDGLEQMNKPSNVVLLIDDEPKIRRFLRAGFELHGFSVLEAENARRRTEGGDLQRAGSHHS